MSSNKHALVVTSSALLDHQDPTEPALGPTANDPAVGSNYQSPAHVGAVNGVHDTVNVTGPEVTEASDAR